MMLINKINNYDIAIMSTKWTSTYIFNDFLEKLKKCVL
jgi:hypothetical protein